MRLATALRSGVSGGGGRLGRVQPNNRSAAGRGLNPQPIFPVFLSSGDIGSDLQHSAVYSGLDRDSARKLQYCKINWPIFSIVCGRVIKKHLGSRKS